MMKKLIAMMLIVTTLVNLVPAAALAGVHTDYVTQVQQMAYIRSLSGMEEDAAPWRPGTAITTNMNGRQVEEALDALLTDTIELALDNMEDLSIFSDDSDHDSDPGYEGFQELLSELRHVRQSVKNTIDTVAYDRDYIYYTLKALTDGETYTGERERETVAYRIIKRTDELKEKIAYAAEHYAAWKAVADRAADLMSSRSTSSGVGMLETDQLAASVTSMKAARLSSLLALNDSVDSAIMSDSEIEVTIVDIDHLGVFVGDKDKNPLPDAAVRCWIPGKEHGDPIPLNDKGFALMPIIDYDADANRMVHVGLEVSLPGYRTQFIESTYCEGGKAFYVLLEENDPNEDVYIGGVSYNGYDILYDHRTMYITQGNDADQKVQVFLYSQSGADFSGDLNLNYLDEQQQEHTLTASYSASSPAPTFVSKLNQQMLPDSDNALYLTGGNGSGSLKMPSLVTTKAAYVRESSFVEDGILNRELLMLGWSFGFPNNIPVLNALHLDVTPPWPNFIAYFDLSGQFVIGGGSRNLGFPKLIESHTTWKTRDQREFEAKAKAIADETGKTIDEAQKQVKKDYNNKETKPKPFLGQTKGYWGVAAYFAGVCAGSVLSEGPSGTGFTVMLMAVLGVKGDYQKQLWAGPVPFTLNFGFDVSVTGIFKTYASDALRRIDDIYYVAHFFRDYDFSIQVSLIFKISVGPGLGAGKAQFSLSPQGKAVIGFTIPVLHGGEATKQGHTKFNFSITFSLVLKMFFVTLTFDMYSGSIGYDFTTKKWSEWKSKPFWDKPSKDAAQTYDALQSAVSVKAIGGDGSSETSLNRTDSYTGDTPWAYQRINDIPTGSVEPYCFSLVSRAGDDDKYQDILDYVVWHENNVVKYRMLDGANGYTATFDMPSEVKAHLDAGDWQVTGVTGFAGPQVYDVPVWEGMTQTHKQVQVVCISATIGCDYQPDEQGTLKPTGSVVVTRLYHSDIGRLQDLAVLTGDGAKAPSVFVQRSKDVLTEVVTMPCLLELTEHRTSGQISSSIVAVDRSNLLASMGYDETKQRAVGFNDKGILAHDSGSYVDIRILQDIDGRPVKMVPCDNGVYGQMMILTDENELCYFSAYRFTPKEVLYYTGSEKIVDFTLLETDRKVNKSVNYSLIHTVECEDGEHKVMIARIVASSSGIENLDNTEFDLENHTGQIYCGTIMDEPYIYWFQSQNTDEADKIMVQGMLYDPEHNLITHPYTLGVLTGSDGSAPTGFDFTSLPIRAHMLKGGKMVITKNWAKNHSGSENQQYEDESAYSTYLVDVKRKVAPVIIGAAAEYPIVSAGKTCNFDFSVLNHGNMPVFGYDIDVYVQNNAGPRLICGKTHVNLAQPENSRVEIYKVPGDPSQGGEVFTGEEAWHRLPGLFDMINGDAWMVKKDGKQQPVFTVPVIMPEGVQTYAMSFHVPYTWSGTALISFEVVNTYFPQYARDLFLTSDNINIAADNMLPAGAADSVVLCISKNSRAARYNQPTEGIVTVAGTLDNFGPQALISRNGASAVDYPVFYMPGDKDCDFTVTDLSIDYRIFRQYGEDYITLTIQREGINDAKKARQATLIAYVNSDTQPSYRATLSTPFSDFHEAYNITMPLRKLTGGRYADLLRITIMDTASQGAAELSNQGNSIVLHLNQALKITRQPASQIVSEGSNAVFYVDAAGGKAPYTYTWQRFEDQHWLDINGADTHVLVLEHVGMAINGTLLRCVVKDSAGNSINSEMAMLSVAPLTDALVISEQPSDKGVPAGHTAVFTVQAEGGVMPYTYRWQVQELDGSWMDVTGADQQQLRLEHVARSMNGNLYRCIVTDAVKQTVISEPAKLTVTKPIPVTGDGTDLPLLSVLLVLSAAVLIMLLRKRKDA